MDKPNRLFRVTLDVDGNLRMYSWSNGSSNWEVEWEAIDDVCTIFGYCGPFAICANLGNCTCPVGFRFINASNPRQGCSRVDSAPLCSINNLVPLQSIDYPYSGDYLYYEDVELEFCLQSCLSDCFCELAMVTAPQQSHGECWLKRSILLNGLSGQNRTIYLRAPVQPLGSSGLSESRKVDIVASAFGAAIIILGLSICALAGISLARKIEKSHLLQLQKKWRVSKDATNLVRFTFKEIQLITNNFSMEIGKGGFGTVFKGQIGYQKHHTDVAVKLLNKVGYREKEFINEVNIIGQIHHFHLVHLLGYCAEADHRILVYEYAEKGSLDRLLFHGDKSKSPVLEWRPRFQIAIQTAQALAHLHNDCNPRIFHCSLKPENILLNSILCVKVTDYGLSKIMTREEIQTSLMQVYNTREYLAPEWSNHQMSITSKTDVFSYGVLLLELISGRRASTSSINNYPMDLHFSIWAYSHIETASFMDVIDPLLTGIANPDEVQRALLVAFWCINCKPHRRPSMVEVVQMLEGHVPIEVPVPRPDSLYNLEEDDENGSMYGRIPIQDVPGPRSDFDFIDDVLLMEDSEDEHYDISSSQASTAEQGAV